MRTDAHADRILNHMYRNVAFTSPVTVYASLLTAVTDLKAGTVTEAAFAGYARVAASFGAPAGEHNGRRLANDAAVTFGTKTDTGSVGVPAIGIHDAASAGNLFDVIFLDADDIPVLGVVTDTTADTIESAAHSLVNAQQVRVVAVPGTGSLPGGLSEDTTYFVVSATADDFQLSATQGGAAINLTSVGAFMVVPLAAVTVNQNDAVQFATGTLKLVK